MTPVGPHTPTGALCLYVGSTFPNPRLPLGSEVTIGSHGPCPAVIAAVYLIHGFQVPECVVLSQGGLVCPALYRDLLLIDNGDPDAEQRTTSKERETC